MKKEITNLLDQYYRYKISHSNNRQRSVAELVKNIRMFFEWVKKPAGQITTKDIESYMFYIRVEMKFAINTQKLKQFSIRDFFRWFALVNHLPDPAAELVPIPEEVRIPIMPTKTEIQSMVYKCNLDSPIGMRNAAMICLLADTGIRASECIALNVHHVQVHEKNYSLLVPKLKSRERIVPFGRLVTGNFIAEIFSYYYTYIRFQENYKPDDPLFKQMGMMHTGGRLSLKSMNRIIKIYVNKAGVDNRISPHSFRHFFGTHSYIHGTPLEVIRQLMGHAWIETTMRYIHIAESIDSDSVTKRGTSDMEAPTHLRGFVNIIKEAQRHVLKSR